MNPARSFGPAIYNWNWESHWMYWVAPISGALAGTLMFRFAFHKKEDQKDEICPKTVIIDDKNKEDA